MPVEHVPASAAMKIEAGSNRLSNLRMFPPREGTGAINHHHRLAKN